MGWLRELMAAGEPALPSFGRLAQLCLSHGEWPQHVQPQARSLAALFSKFDRSLELEWLKDRADVQHVLARVLGCSGAELSRPIAAGTQRREENTSRWRLADAPLARAIDLLDEPLPPGLAEALDEPDQWRRVVWSAPSRAERELVGRWLSARRLAEVIPGPPAEPVTELPLLVSLEDPSEMGPSPPSRGRICLAFIRNPRLPWEDGDSAWPRLPAPRLLDCVPALANWLVDRFPADSRITREILRQWLVRGIRDDVIDGFEAALGLAAALDELEPHPSLAWSWSQLAERFVVFRLERASVKERAEVQWLSSNSLPTLGALLERLLQDPERSWDAPRTPDQWLAAIPAELRFGLDADWARRSLPHAAARPLLAKELEQALAKVPPGAFRILRALEAAGLLQGVDEQVLGPRWLCLALRRSIEQRLVHGTATAWGEALLHPELAARIKAQLERRLIEEPVPMLEGVLELEDNRSAGATFAIETAFSLVGTALLLEEVFDTEILNQLWQAQQARWLQLDPERVVPCLSCAARDKAAWGGWLLAAWAIAEQLESLRTHPCLNPWSAASEVPESAFDAVLAHVSSPSCSETLSRKGFALATRIEVWSGITLNHGLFLPGRFAAQPNADDLAALAQQPRLCAAAVDALEKHPEGRVQQIWAVWSAAGQDASHLLLAPTGPHAARFWTQLPDSVLAELLREGHPFTQGLPYHWLSTSNFQHLLLSGNEWTFPALEHLPAQLLQGALESFAQRKRSQPLEALWRFFEQRVVDGVRALCEREEWGACAAILAAAPVPEHRYLLDWVAARVEKHGVADPIAHMARSWLQCVAATPGPLRLQAFDTLADIESRLRRLQLASS